MPSVVPVVSTTERRLAALMNRAALTRAPSYASVARSLSVGVTVVIVHRPDHGFGLLAGIGAVEIHERLAVHHLAQDREVRADRGHVERRGRTLWHPVLESRTGILCANAVIFSDQQGPGPIE
jgi:hypothetical protein